MAFAGKRFGTRWLACAASCVTWTAMNHAWGVVPESSTVRDAARGGEVRPRRGFVPRRQVGFVLGAGVTSFSAGDASPGIGTGASWNARFLLGTRSIFGAEAAYVGAAMPVQSDTVSMLVRNGGEALFRVQRPLPIGSRLLTPYAVGGAGFFQHSAFNERGADRGLTTIRDVTMEVPAGGGLMLSGDGFILDARFTYRFSLEGTGSTRSDRSDLDTWTLGGNIGWEY